MKAIMISIKPEMVAKILNGEKTIEIRKTMPKCELPCKVYIYCTRSFKSLRRYDDSAEYGKYRNKFYITDHNKHSLIPTDIWNGKVVAEFTLNKVECFTTDYRKNAEQTARICRRSCVDIDDSIDYEFGSPCLYAWHIDDLKIYDEPIELSEFTHWIYKLKKPPAGWCYVKENSDVKD